METYTSIAHSAETVTEIKKSVFIGNAVCVSEKEDADRFIDEIRSRHPDARHCCYAYILRKGGFSKASDDGEPQGTAGLPMLEILKKNGVTDVAVTVTRYFGGILLGAAGLVRAYTSACAEAVKAGGICVYTEFAEIRIDTEYGDFPKIENELRKLGAITESPIFTDRVSVKAYVEADKASRILTVIKDVSASRAKAETVGTQMRPKVNIP